MQVSNMVVNLKNKLTNFIQIQKNVHKKIILLNSFLIKW